MFLLVGSLATLLLVGGIAGAFWATTGTGSGSDAAVSAQTLTVTAAASPTADLYPGASGALQFTVTNPNPYPVTLTSVTYGAITSSNPTNCPAANLVAATGGVLGTAIPVSANGTSGNATMPNAVTLASTAPNGCQGIIFTIVLTLTGVQT